MKFTSNELLWLKNRVDYLEGQVYRYSIELEIIKSIYVKIKGENRRSVEK